jgi:hypothetical protein
MDKPQPKVRRFGVQTKRPSTYKGEGLYSSNSYFDFTSLADLLVFMARIAAMNQVEVKATRIESSIRRKTYKVHPDRADAIIDTQLKKETPWQD